MKKVIGQKQSGWHGIAMSSCYYLSLKHFFMLCCCSIFYTNIQAQDPFLATSCYSYGNYEGSTVDGIVAAPLPTAPSADGFQNTLSQASIQHLATFGQVGATFGLANRKSTKTLYAAAFIKRHSGLGPNGTGAIYQIDLTGVNPPSLFVDLNAIFGANTAGVNPHPFSPTDVCPNQEGFSNNFSCWYNDVNTWNAVGREGLGDIDISEDEQYLYVMNMSNKTVYKIPFANPTASNITLFPFPTSLPGATVACGDPQQVRPMGLGVKDGKVYVGAICTEEVDRPLGGVGGDKVYVYALDPTTGTWAESLEGSIQRNKYEVDVWPANYMGDYRDAKHMIVSDIEFGNTGEMILGIRDISGDRFGNAAGPPIEAINNNLIYTSQGNILKACLDAGIGRYVLENNGTCGALTSTDPNTGAESGFGLPGDLTTSKEFYYGDELKDNLSHAEISLGGAAFSKNLNEVFITAYDITGFSQQGIIGLNNNTGARSTSYVVIEDSNPASSFGKANGLGDLELCEIPPCSIVAEATGTNVLCKGQATGTANTINVMGNKSAVTYLWSNGATTANIANLIAGTYTVTVTESDNTACFTTATYTVTEPAQAMTIMVNGTNIKCKGSATGTATASANSLATPITYLWSNGATTATISNLTAGTYTVTATDASNCTITGSYTVTEPATQLELTISGGLGWWMGIFIGGAGVEVTGNQGAVSYLWSTGATTQKISLSTPGKYSVTVTDAEGCMAVAQIDISDPTQFHCKGLMLNVSEDFAPIELKITDLLSQTPLSVVDELQYTFSTGTNIITPDLFGQTIKYKITHPRYNRECTGMIGFMDVGGPAFNIPQNTLTVDGEVDLAFSSIERVVFDRTNNIDLDFLPNNALTNGTNIDDAFPTEPAFEDGIGLKVGENNDIKSSAQKGDFDNFFSNLVQKDNILTTKKSPKDYTISVKDMSGIAKLSYVDKLLFDNDCYLDKTVVRTWIASDPWGNSSTAQFTIQVKSLSLDVTIADATITCKANNTDKLDLSVGNIKENALPKATLMPQKMTYFNQNGLFEQERSLKLGKNFNLNLSYKDNIENVYCANQVVQRTWTISDICTKATKQSIQNITIQPEGTNGKQQGIVSISNSLANDNIQLEIIDQLGKLTSMPYIPNSSNILYDYNNAITIIPKNNDAPLNGISTMDLLKIQKHILGVEPFTKLNEWIAADVNRSKGISTSDIIELRKMILRLTDNFSNNQSWRFVNSNSNLPKTIEEFAQMDIVENSILDNINTSAKFEAIKVGDVNFSHINSRGNQAVTTTHLLTQNMELKEGNTYPIQFQFEQAALIKGYQFTMNFDMLEIIDIKGLEANKFAIIDNHTLTVSNDIFASNHLGSFEILFKAKKDAQLNDLLRINSSLTSAEAYSSNEETSTLKLKFVEPITSKESLKIYENRPNPFTESTIIPFYIDEAENVAFRVFDLNGKLILSKNAYFEKGNNEITLYSNDLSSSGVLIYEIQTAKSKQHRKIIFVNNK